MIYSKDYPELYRRVMAGERVLCLVSDSQFPEILHPCICKGDEYGASVHSPGVGHISNIKTEQKFLASCKNIGLQFVPDNEGLVKAARNICCKTGFIFRDELLQLQTELKKYDNEDI
jgi:hypothetical protein